MTFETLQAARSGMTRAFESRHNYVQLPRGRWTRVLGTPRDSETLTVQHVKRRTWRATFTRWGALCQKVTP
jgi:hypothetical protein